MLRLGEAAAAYAASGWRVFPLGEASKLPALPRAHPAGHPCRGGCGRHGHGYHDATTDPETIATWWRRYPTANIGLTCAPNGVAVVDVDPRHGGDVTLAMIEARIGALPSTLTGFTGGDGVHLVYAHPGVSLPGTLGPGVDVKANGYIVAPPSVHPDTGHRYVWSGTIRRPAPWPTALLPRRHSTPTPSPTRCGRSRSMHGLVATVETARQGCRNGRLFWAACRAAEHAAAGRLSVDVAARTLLAAALRAGLPEPEARRTITSAFRTNHLETA